MKKWEKILAIIIACAVGLLALTVILTRLWWEGSLDFGRINVDTEASPNGAYSVTLQQIGSPGFPFGSVRAQITVRDANGKKVKVITDDIANDGTQLHDSQWSLDWQNTQVLITVTGADGDIYKYTVALNE